VHQRTAGIDDVVDQNAALTFDITDHIHDLRLARPLATLVANGDRHVDALGEPARAHHTAHVRRDDHQVGGAVALLNIAHHNGSGEQIVGGNVEETLNLAGVQVNRHHPVDARPLDEVGDEFGGNGSARAWPA